MSTNENKLIKCLQPVFSHSDDRGSVVQLFQENMSQVNVLKCIKGSERGGHYHKINTESFYVIDGKVRVKLKTLESNPTTEEIVFGKGGFFSIPPLINHELYFEEDSILIATYDKGIILPNGSKDIYIYIYISM